MASLFGALGSLAESYGLARQNVEESNLRRIQQQLEQRYADMAGQRLGIEQEEQQRLRQQFGQEFQERQQEFAQRQKEWADRQREAQNVLQDLGMPISTDPNTGEQTKPFYRPFYGDWVTRRIPGTGVTGKDSQQYIDDVSQNNPKLRQYLTTEANRLSKENQGNQAKVLAGLGKIAGEYLKEEREAALKGTKASTKLEDTRRQLNVLKTAMSGLKNTVGVLDSWQSRAKLLGSGVSQQAPKEGVGPLAAVAGTMLLGGQALAKGNLTDEEWAYYIQLKRAREAIQVMRTFTGLPRSVAATIETLYQQLPDPTTPSSARGRQQIALIEELIRKVEEGLATAGGETTVPTVPGAALSLDDILNRGAARFSH